MGHFLILLGCSTRVVASVDPTWRTQVTQPFPGEAEFVSSGGAGDGQRAVVLTVVLDHQQGPSFELGLVRFLHDIDPFSWEGGKKSVTAQTRVGSF